MNPNTTAGSLNVLVRRAGMGIRLLATLPIMIPAIPVAAWADARHRSGRPDIYPARHRVIYYMADWWSWVCTGEFRSDRARLVESPNAPASATPNAGGSHGI